MILRNSQTRNRATTLGQEFSDQSLAVESMPLLRLKEVSKSFGGLKALSLVCFDITNGQLKALIGPNGAGKSTLLNVISRLYRPDSGQVEFLGCNLLTYSAHEVAGLGMGRTFQMVQFSGSMSVIKSVMVGAHSLTKKGIISGSLKLPSERREEKEIRDMAYQVLELVGMQFLANRPTNSLTYADQKRTDLARTLVGKPKMLLLDEPGAGLNKLETEELGKLLLKIKESGITILLVEHNMPLVMSIADEVVVLNYGNKIAEGTPAEIAADANVIEAYLGGEIGAASSH